MQLRPLLRALSILLIFGGVEVEASNTPPLPPGQSVNLKIPGEFKGMGTREGYFYTPGPVTVVAYETPCVVTIRDPANPDPPVATGSMESTNPAYETNLAPGFYYISVTCDCGVLVGVAQSSTCNGFYHYVSTGEAYGNSSMASKFFVRGTGFCDNRMFVFSPQGPSMGGTCCDTLCFDACGFTYEISSPNQFYEWMTGYIFGNFGVASGAPVQVLTREDPGYFVPPYLNDSLNASDFYTYQGENEFLNIHSFDDDVSYRIVSLHSDSFGVIESGSLENGETYSYVGTSNNNNRVLRVETTKGQASVSVIGGLNPEDNTNYMSYVLDQNGHFQGTDFITRASTDGFLFLTGLQDSTTVEVRGATTEALQSVHPIGEGELVNAAPGSGIWRIRSDKDITVAVGHGNGGTFIPLTQNTTGTTPYPPVIAGIRWDPNSPTTSDTTFTVTFLTDEDCQSKLNYKVGSDPWQQTPESPPGTEHSHSISIDALNSFAAIRFRPEARDLSGSVTVASKDGGDYVVNVREDTPDLRISIFSTFDQGTVRTVRYSIENMGTATAHKVFLRPEISGFQPINDGASSNYASMDNNQILSRVPVPNIGPGQTIFFDLNLVPFMGVKKNFNYEIVDCSIEYQDPFGRLTERFPFDMFHRFDLATIRSEMAVTRYVVLANPKRFFENRSSTDPAAQKVPREMAKFAVARQGVLAFITLSDENEIRSTIYGRFDGLINKSWLDAGYLLLVGSSAEFPSFHRSLDCPFTDKVQMWMSDNVYANVDKDENSTPELIVGRITGDHPDTYSALFQRALTPNYFDKSLTISGTGDGDSEFYSNAKECNQLLDQKYTDAFIYRLRNFEESIRNNVYLFNSDNTDFFYYRNHGYVGGWDYFGRSDVSRISFGSKYPIIYSNSCLTGQVQSDNNLAEEFLGRNASVFIGATEVSPRSPNNELGKKIVNYHKQGHSIGQAFRNGKRSLAGDLHWYSLCWSRLNVSRENGLYNIYGDPFRGTTNNFPKDSVAKTTFDPPVETLDITVPMYEVDRDPDGVDFVNIPDDENGGHLDVVKEPLVPSFRVTANYEPGIRVTDIQLISRSGQVNESGLNLPVSWWNQKIPIGPNDGPSPGTFPSDDFHWEGIERLDGGQELMLTIHPFFYNAATKDATFYQDYSFHIDFVTSTVNIESVTPAFLSVPIGANQEIDVRLTNSGASEVRVNLSLEIENMGTFEVASSQSQNGIVIPAGGSVVRHFNWDPSGSAATHYQIRAQVRDAVHLGELDAGYDQFRVGDPHLSIKSLSFGSVTPGFIGNGEVADVGMEIESIGDIPEAGTLTLEIRHRVEGNLIDQWQHKFSELVPGATLTYNADWNSGGTPPGQYQLIGWAEHEGGTTPLEVVPFETQKEMYWKWESILDVYRHGDKIVGTANLLHPDGSLVGLADTAQVSVIRPDLTTLEPGFATHAMDPHYSTQFIINALDPSGIHSLRANGMKTGYQDALDNRWFVVTENPFTMTASPRVVVADGITTVRVQSEVIRDGTSPISDGTLVTLNALVGSIATEDASPALGGKQVAAVGGHFEFDWLSPTVTALDAFTHAFFGEEGPQSGISVAFKGIDFNGNRRVDVADIGFVRVSEGDLMGTDTFDPRKDLNGDDVIDASDTAEVLDRWSLEFADANPCPICTPTPKTYGVKIRPVPERALIPPGGELTIEIVAEGLDRMGGYEFGSVLVGDSLEWMGEPMQNPTLKTTIGSQHQLGPVPYDTGYRLGATLIEDGTGVSGMTTLATLTVMAAQDGETNLILSAPVIVRVDGTEQAIMQTVEGIYEVGIPTHTPTATPTVSSTPTRTPTSEPTPTWTPGSLEGYDVWPPPEGDGRIDSRDLLEWLNRIGSEQGDSALLFDFAQFWDIP